jgi:hypothetical protein
LTGTDRCDRSLSIALGTQWARRRRPPTAARAARRRLSTRCATTRGISTAWRERHSWCMTLRDAPSLVQQNLRTTRFVGRSRARRDADVRLRRQGPTRLSTRAEVEVRSAVVMRTARQRTANLLLARPLREHHLRGRVLIGEIFRQMDQ